MTNAVNFTPPAMEPLDSCNQEWMRNVHPPGWTNPIPKPRYDLVVIGAGPAGLVTAAGAAGLGATVALIEKDRMGGDCLNTGCVPSKALLRCARAAFEARDGSRFGVRVGGPITVDFPAVMERMRHLRSHISPHDSVQRFKQLGVDVFLGQGRFTDSNTIEAGGKMLRFARAVIAAGARASTPFIQGLAEAEYYTNETIFTLTRLPLRLAVLGAGPIGCELAQAFARFGSQVTLIESDQRILIREDDDAARRIEAALERDGVKIICGGKTTQIVRNGNEKVFHLDCHGEKHEFAVDAILVGVGRKPNVEGLNLETAGVAYDPRAGVLVDDRLRTTNPHIYAAGDICSRYKFTHAADAMARMVIRNALFLGRAKASALTIPWCTYTDPEIAHVGGYEQDALEAKIPVTSFTIEMKEVDRAILDGEEEGFLKIHIRKGTDRIFGATIVARHAGDIIGELSLAMTAGVGLAKIANAIHPYPTQAEVIKKAADAYNRARLTPLLKRLCRQVLAWQR